MTTLYIVGGSPAQRTLPRPRRQVHQPSRHHAWRASPRVRAASPTSSTAQTAAPPSTVMRDLGVRIDEASPTELIIHGRGLDGLQEPSGFLDCANSGTTMRLLAGLVAGQPFTTFLTGTEQIRRRPMDRIVSPLRLMGARITGRQNGRYAPLAFDAAKLRAMEYDMPVASAQVKSCLILAGLYARDLTVIRQPGPPETIPSACLPPWARPLRSTATPSTARSRRSRCGHSTSACRRSVIRRLHRCGGRHRARQSRHHRRRLHQRHAHRLLRCARQDGRVGGIPRRARDVPASLSPISMSSTPTCMRQPSAATKSCA